MELASPANPSPQLLKNGDIIPLQNASAYPTTERVLASFAAVLRGGGIPNVEVIASEVRNMLTGRADQIHDFLKLDTFTARLNEQRDDITRAIDSTDRLLTYVAKQSDTLDHVLTEFPHWQSISLNNDSRSSMRPMRWAGLATSSIRP